MDNAGGGNGDVRNSEAVSQSFQKQVCKEILAPTNATLPMIYGPGHAREKLRGVILEAQPGRVIRMIATSMAGRSGANEVIRNGLADEFLEDYAIQKEMKRLKKYGRISSNGAVAYGEQALIRAMNEGAIETLLVAVDLLRDHETQLMANSSVTGYVV